VPSRPELQLGFSAASPVQAFDRHFGLRPADAQGRDVLFDTTQICGTNPAATVHLRQAYEWLASRRELIFDVLAEVAAARLRSSLRL